MLTIVSVVGLFIDIGKMLDKIKISSTLVLNMIAGKNGDGAVSDDGSISYVATRGTNHSKIDHETQIDNTRTN